MKLKLLLGLALLAGLASCNGAEKPPTPADDSPELATARKEIEFQQEDDKPEDRAAARRAALDYARSKFPDRTIKGIATARYHANAYVALVQLEKGGQVQVLNLHVTNFFSDDGKSHWAAVTNSDTLEKTLHEAADAETSKRLNNALRESEP